MMLAYQPPSLAPILVVTLMLAVAEAQLSDPSNGVYLQLSDVEQAGHHPEALPVPTRSTNRGFDPQLVDRGMVAFDASCTQCHDAERATDKRKSYENWLVTVRKMAAKEDAEIAAEDFVPIATYLASLGPPSSGSGQGTRASEQADKGENDDTNRDKDKDKDEDKDEDKKSDESSTPRFDQAEVARGRAAFESSCTQCHDAERALSKRKSRAGWLATVRRMARMADADINSADIGPIATYLASLSAPQSNGTAAGDSESSSATDEASETLGLGSGLSISGTLSTLWRGGNDNLETPNFFADTWVRADWQPSGPLRARVTTCTSCHSDNSGGAGFTLELVEASAYFDLMHPFREKHQRPTDCPPRIEAEASAGRFVVPFGAYHAMVHPGVYRTVTNPLIFNMGRQVNPDNSRPPVLPMPYSDEGFNLHAMLPLTEEWKVNLDGYAVNGLQGGGSGVNFTRSRSYADNNQYAGYGGRATVGNQKTRLGGSVMAGRLEDQGAAPLNYHLAGADAVARLCDDDVRLYFEYAIRRNDSVFGKRQISYGIVTELEVLLLSDPNLNALVRYDTQEHRDFFGETSIERFTWGLSTTAIGGSLLIINHEHWNFPTEEIPDVDVLGVRWVATF